VSVGKIICYEGYEIITMNMDGPKCLELVPYILMMGRQTHRIPEKFATTKK
jgi:hypothetical protein